MKNAICTNFGDIRSAFDYFVAMGGTVGVEGLSSEEFSKALMALFPKRFSTVDVACLWA